MTCAHTDVITVTIQSQMCSKIIEQPLLTPTKQTVICLNIHNYIPVCCDDFFLFDPWSAVD